ncbi:MAG: SixA phosphatase family protein, partial [Campylobacterales bacterium]
MIILFVRHAIALERYEWSDDDILRPLSDKGVVVAREFFSSIAPILQEADTIISSKATRAMQTADILIETLGLSSYQKDSALNPGCTIKDVKNILSKHSNSKKLILVGHEPDFSEIISSMTSDSIIAMKLKKPSLAEVKLYDAYKGELQLLLQPKP